MLPPGEGKGRDDVLPPGEGKGRDDGDVDGRDCPPGGGKGRDDTGDGDFVGGEGRGDSELV